MEVRQVNQGIPESILTAQLAGGHTIASLGPPVHAFAEAVYHDDHTKLRETERGCRDHLGSTFDPPTVSTLTAGVMLTVGRLKGNGSTAV